MTQPVARIAEVTAAIAALTVPGITLFDTDTMPVAVSERALPIFGPSSNDPYYLTDWESVRLSLQGNYRNSYTLNWKLYHAPAGADRGLFAQYPAMIESTRKLVEAIQALPRIDGCKSIALIGMPQLGAVVDALNKNFHGAVFALRVVEF